jgi:hypothetical protein
MWNKLEMKKKTYIQVQWPASSKHRMRLHFEGNNNQEIECATFLSSNVISIVAISKEKLLKTWWMVQHWLIKENLYNLVEADKYHSNDEIAVNKATKQKCAACKENEKSSYILSTVLSFKTKKLHFRLLLLTIVIMEKKNECRMMTFEFAFN